VHHYAAPVNGVLAKAQAKLAALGYYNTSVRLIGVSTDDTSS